MSAHETVTVQLSVDEAVLVTAIAHRWEVEKRLKFENVAEYFALQTLSTRIASQEAVARLIWAGEGADPTEARSKAERVAAERITEQLKSQRWPAEWLERYPPRAYVDVGYGFRILATADANTKDFSLLLTRLVERLASQISAADGADFETAKRELVGQVLERLQHER